MSQYASDHCYTNRGPSPPISVVSDDPDKDVSHDNSKHVDTATDIDDIPRKKTLKVKRVVTRVGSRILKLRFNPLMHNFPKWSEHFKNHAANV